MSSACASAHPPNVVIKRNINAMLENAPGFLNLSMDNSFHISVWIFGLKFAMYMIALENYIKVFSQGLFQGRDKIGPVIIRDVPYAYIPGTSCIMDAAAAVRTLGNGCDYTREAQLAHGAIGD